jgi:hypothetical protein
LNQGKSISGDVYSSMAEPDGINWPFSFGPSPEPRLSEPPTEALEFSLSAAKLLRRRIAANIAKLPELVRKD